MRAPGDTAPVDEQRIDAILTQRNDAKRARDFRHRTTFRRLRHMRHQVWTTTTLRTSRACRLYLTR